MSYLHRARSPLEGAGIVLAIAAYRGLSAPTSLALVESVSHIAKRIDVEVYDGNCHVDDGRNLLVRNFLESDHEQLVFIDADVFWHWQDLKRLIEYDRDIVAGVYPKRSDEDGDPFPVKPLPGPRTPQDGLVEVEGVPTGFLKIRRRVLERLDASSPKFVVRHDLHRPIPEIFKRTLNGISRRGGDYEFCRAAREAGYSVWVDPMMELGHVGAKLWTGCLGHWWRKDVAMHEDLAAIREGRDSAATYLELSGVWNNAWSLSPEALFTAVCLARKAKGPILDCGSGLSSLCMSASTTQPVIAMESSPEWAAKLQEIGDREDLTNLIVYSTDVDNSGWYTEIPPITKYALVICDGPERKHDRSGLFTRLLHAIGEAVILVDDVDDPKTLKMAQDYCSATGRTLHSFDEVSKPFVLIT